jgi:hypothetical protein
MQLVRVLLLESVDDAIAARRRRAIERNPTLSGYVFAHCYVLDLTDEERALGELRRTTLDSHDVLTKLAEDVGRFHPEVLLVHTGMALTRFPVPILSAVSALKAQSPKLKMGIQKRDWFGISAEVKALIGQPDLFDESPDIDLLRREVFGQG